ncbi:MAG: hypothetical protein AAF078_01605 [Planctomycetota bacterium]
MPGFANNEKWDRWLYIVGGVVFFLFFGLAGVGILAEGPRDPGEVHWSIAGLPEASAWQQYLGGVVSLLISLGGLAFSVYWWRQRIESSDE